MGILFNLVEGLYKFLEKPEVEEVEIKCEHKNKHLIKISDTNYYSPSFYGDSRFVYIVGDMDKDYEKQNAIFAKDEVCLDCGECFHGIKEAEEKYKNKIELKRKQKELAHKIWNDCNH